MASAQKILHEVFGFDTFRPLQQEIIKHVTEGNDALVIMPTGGGKSLCYQIPALMFDGLTIVVSPLISLMKNQVEQLSDYNIPALFLNSSISREEYRQNVERLKRDEVKLLYLAPETLLMPRTLNLLNDLNIDCLTIDEAHCISEWGHDFRPEYRQLSEVRQKFPDAVTIALTATATPRVQQDITDTLELKKSGTFIASFDRENLFLEIQRKWNTTDQIVSFLNQHKNQSGIIYCFSRSNVDELHKKLSDLGFSTRPYHAGLSKKERSDNQDAFIRDDIDIIVATIAFGMGINKPNVRFVIHRDLPQNIESYYQQIGRAGRDGLRADCLLLFGYGDIGKIKYFIDQKSEEEQQVANRHLDSLLNFVESYECRRVPLLDYFGESYPEEECNMCDNCVGEKIPKEDLTTAAQKFMSCMVRTGQRYGAVHIGQILTGSKAQKIRSMGHTNLPTYGIGKEYTQKRWTSLARLLIRKGYIDRDNKYGGLQLKPKGVAILKGEAVVKGIIDAGVNNKKRATVSRDQLEYDPVLFEVLRKQRKALADSKNVPPYVIFPDTTLIEMAYYYPQSEESLIEIHGIGSVKLRKYGNIFMDVIKKYCSEHDIPEKMGKTG